MLGKITISLVLLSWLSSLPAAAQSSLPQRKLCAGESATLDQQIQACSALIASGKEKPEGLSLAYYFRGLAYWNNGESTLAIRDYDQAIRLKPDFAFAFNNRCFARAVVNQLQLALADCNESIRLNPKNGNAYDSRGLTYLKLGQADAAISDYNASLALRPNNAHSLFGRGAARIRKGDAAGGNADIAKAKTIDSAIVSKYALYGISVR